MSKSTEYLYGCLPSDFIYMNYLEALRYKRDKAKALYFKLKKSIEEDGGTFEKRKREFHVYNAWKFNEKLIDEAEQDMNNIDYDTELDMEIYKKMKSCLLNKINEILDSSWNLDRLLENKYWNIGCPVVKILTEIPAGKDQTRRDIYLRLINITWKDKDSVLMGGEYGSFLSFTDKKLKEMIKNVKNGQDINFWPHINFEK